MNEIILDQNQCDRKKCFWFASLLVKKVTCLCLFVIRLFYVFLFSFGVFFVFEMGQSICFISFLFANRPVLLFSFNLRCEFIRKFLDQQFNTVNSYVRVYECSETDKVILTIFRRTFYQSPFETIANTFFHVLGRMKDV